MKYGYMNYRKHFLPNKNERPMNIGDPIQSFAVLELYEKIGIIKEDIVPLDRYDLADYDGEDIVALINGPETYEYFAYASRFLPISNRIYPVFVGLHLHRELSEIELKSLRDNQPIGCRDEDTVDYLKSKGVDAFLSGCLTMLFPKRDEKKEYNKVFIVDCSENTLEHVPVGIKENAEYLSQVIRMKSDSNDCRLTLEEAEEYNKIARKQLNRYRDEAKLVITSRLHVACPCAAMGVPVVLVRDTYDERYQFIDRFLPLYYPEDLECLDWNSIKGEIPKEIKEKLTSTCKTMLDLAISRKDLMDIYSKKIQDINFAGEEEIAVNKLPMNINDNFVYYIWGVCMPNSYLLYEQIQRQYPNARMKYAIDTYATGIYKDNIRIIHPDVIEKIADEDAWIFVIAPAAHDAAYKELIGKYNFVLINGSNIKIYNK